MKQLFETIKTVAAIACCHRALYGALAAGYCAKCMDVIPTQPVELWVLGCYFLLAWKG